MWRKGDPSVLLVGMQIDAATVKIKNVPWPVAKLFGALSIHKNVGLIPSQGS